MCPASIVVLMTRIVIDSLNRGAGVEVRELEFKLVIAWILPFEE